MNFNISVLVCFDPSFPYYSYCFGKVFLSFFFFFLTFHLCVKSSEESIQYIIFSFNFFWSMVLITALKILLPVNPTSGTTCTQSVRSYGLLCPER